MAMLEGTRAARFELVTAGHHFMNAVLPLRHPESRQALGVFGQQAAAVPLSSPDRDAVLLTVLAALDPHTGGRLPSLVDRYLALRRQTPDGVARFVHCVEDVIRYRGIGHPHVQRAIAVLHERYADPDLTEAEIATIVDLTPSALCTAFRRQTDLTPLGYLQHLRLDHAAARLVASSMPIKQIRFDVGYRDDANFAHDFRARAGTSPTEYRARGIPLAPTAPADRLSSPAVGRPPTTSRRRVLIVDDDQGTRDTLGTWLRLDGYGVGTAASARDALAAIGRDEWDALILDAHLGDMDGLACLRTIRQRQPGLRPAVVLFTADWDIGDQAEEVHALGATLLFKLCDITEIERVIASVCALQLSTAGL